MKRANFDPKTVLLIVLVFATVLYDTFTPGTGILPIPILSFLQGFILIAAPAAIWWMIAKKIKFNRSRHSSGIEINYRSNVSYQVNEKRNSI